MVIVVVGDCFRGYARPGILGHPHLVKRPEGYGNNNP
jgi:hypothetical protein